MGIIGGPLAYRILKRICADGDTGYMDGSVYIGKSKLEVLFGPQFWSRIAGKVVIDFGCGEGMQSIEMVQRGAAHVIGVDTYAPVLERARANAARFGVADRCTFTTEASEPADAIVALDSFEHFSDPAAILATMRRLVRPDGFVVTSFGPTWYHPLGGHIFSVFPWAHFVFTEQAFMRWFADFNPDRHTSFASVGLNRMTVAWFERLVAGSEWRFANFEAVPIRKLRRFHNRVTREFTTATVRCCLVPRESRIPASISGDARSETEAGLSTRGA